MDDVIEIDLRKLILNLLANWKWILGISFVFGLVAFLYSYLQPDVYQAKAVIAIVKPRYIANFDPQYQTVNTGSPTSKALLDVVNSDSIISQVYTAWQSEQKELVSFDNFRDNALEATAGGDQTILILKVSLKDPAEAAKLANQWARLSVKLINLLYSGVDESQLAFFDQQIEISTGNMRNAENALVEFEAADQTALLQNELDSLLALQFEGLRKQRLLQNTRKDALGILQTLEANPVNAPVVSQIQENFKVLQLRLYTDPGISQTSSQIQLNTNTAFGETPLQFELNVEPGFEQVPIQLQLSDASGIVTISTADLRKLITDWIAVLEDHYQELEENTSKVETQVLDYQQQLSEFNNKRQALELEYSVVKETYGTLLRKQKEVRISSDDHNGDAQLASLAKVPEERLPHNTVRNTIIGLVTGGILAILFVLLWDWFTKIFNSSPT
jgi:uncharacterized protein involved in exopolysaccharide biosynthesis